MNARPERTEAVPYYFTYIDQVKSDDVLATLESQLQETPRFLRDISEEKSLYRYGAGKWSIRELLGHVNDAERAFVFRALWFARGFDSPLPSFDQNISAKSAKSDAVPWESHIEEFRAVRESTLLFFRNLPDEAWLRSGIASDVNFTVRALAFITAGHLTHHMTVVRQRYL